MDEYITAMGSHNSTSSSWLYTIGGSTTRVCFFITQIAYSWSVDGNKILQLPIEYLMPSRMVLESEGTTLTVNSEELTVHNTFISKICQFFELIF